jgi:hypothetical protein
LKEDAGRGGEARAWQLNFTVFALDRSLPIVQNFGGFVPGGPEGLYQEFIEASRHGQVLASAGIAGSFSAVPAN